MDLVLEIVQRTLLSGEVESAAARIGALLLDDRRVEPALDAFVYDLARGVVASAPVQDPSDLTVYLVGLLHETRLVGSDMSEDELRAAVGPYADEIVSLEREGIAIALAESVLASGVVTGTADPDRAERVLLFGLYRRVLEAFGELTRVRRVDLLLVQSS
jgi:hypothetical protein